MTNEFNIFLYPGIFTSFFLFRHTGAFDFADAKYAERVSHIKTESIRKSRNINFIWTKIEYKNNLNPVVLFPTLFKS